MCHSTNKNKCKSSDKSSQEVVNTNGDEYSDGNKIQLNIKLESVKINEESNYDRSSEKFIMGDPLTDERSVF